MAIKTTKVNKYGTLDVSGTNRHLKCCLVLRKDATWHLYRSATDTLAPKDPFESDGSQHSEAASVVQTVWKNWEDFNLHMSETAARMQHELLFNFKADKKEVKENITVAIWAYRCLRATSYLTDAPQIGAAGEIIRKSKIANRTYELLPIPANLKILTDNSGIVNTLGRKVTGKQGLACYLIIAQSVDNQTKLITEAELKLIVEKRGKEVTAKDNAWRFFQFYRPIFVDAGLIKYHKVPGTSSDEATAV